MGKLGNVTVKRRYWEIIQATAVGTLVLDGKQRLEMKRCERNALEQFESSNPVDGAPFHNW